MPRVFIVASCGACGCKGQGGPLCIRWGVGYTSHYMHLAHVESIGYAMPQCLPSSHHTVPLSTSSYYSWSRTEGGRWLTLPFVPLPQHSSNTLHTTWHHHCSLEITSQCPLLCLCNCSPAKHNINYFHSSSLYISTISMVYSAHLVSFL